MKNSGIHEKAHLPPLQRPHPVPPPPVGRASRMAAEPRHARILYRAGCWDSRVAAALVYKYFLPGARVVCTPVKCDTRTPWLHPDSLDIDGLEPEEEVFLLGVCGSPTWLTRVVARALRVIVYDYHAATVAALGDWKAPANVLMTIVTRESTARLIWQRHLPGDVSRLYTDGIMLLDAYARTDDTDGLLVAAREYNMGLTMRGSSRVTQMIPDSTRGDLSAQTEQLLLTALRTPVAYLCNGGRRTIAEDEAAVDVAVASARVVAFPEVAGAHSTIAQLVTLATSRLIGPVAARVPARVPAGNIIELLVIVGLPSEPGTVRLAVRGRGGTDIRPFVAAHGGRGDSHAGEFSMTCEEWRVVPALTAEAGS